MTSVEYDNIDNTFYKINSDLNFCDFNYDFIRWKIPKYNKCIDKINNIKYLDFNDYSKCKAVLNKKFIGSKESELNDAEIELHDIKMDIFKFLDSKENPCKYILHPYYYYGANLGSKNVHSKVYGYIKDCNSGLDNIDLAFEYLKYKIGIGINNLIIRLKEDIENGKELSNKEE